MTKNAIPLIAFSLLVQISFSQSKSSDLYLQTSEMNNSMVHYAADRGNIMRFYAASNQGRNDYNSPERRQRLLQLISSYIKQIDLLDFDKMNINGKVDYILFRRDLEDERYQLWQEQEVYESIKKNLPFADRIYTLEKPRRRGISVDAEAVAKELNNIGKEISLSIRNLKTIDSLEARQAAMSVDAVRSLQAVLRNYYNFYNGYDPMFSWWVPRTYTGVDSLLNIYASAVTKRVRSSTTQKDDGSGIMGNPIGRDELIRQLKHEFIPYTPEELVDIANKEFAWCDTQLLRTSRAMGFGDDWKAAQEKVKNTFVPPGKQPEAMLQLYNESVDFLRKNNLITIPSLAEETWRVYMMSPERQLVAPFFLGGESLIISYPTSTMTYDEKMMSMRGNNPHFSRATVHHELIAGHELQGFMQDRYKAYRNFNTPFWTEGNSLYWELLLWNLKFPQSHEDRIGMLFWRMHRCARIIFSLNYHLGKWTPQQCIDFLVDRVGHERANAEGEVRRSFTGGYGPLYQIAYMIGGMQFWALKKELVDTRKMTYIQYHDAILHENSMPIEMLRAILTNQSLKKDFQTNWRFYKN